MHALAVSVSIESGKTEEAMQHLRSEVIPRVKQSPGLVSGYWMDPQGGHGYALLIYESEDAAKGAKEMAETAPRPEFVKVNTAQVMEVIESV